MNDLQTSRPFRQRFLDGFDRSGLRDEVQKVKPRRLSGMRKKYASWALGGALAIGGIGIPMKVGSMFKDTQASATAAQRAPQTAPPPADQPEKATTIQIATDVNNAQKIASAVANGVADGVTSAAQGVTSAATEVAKTVEPANVAQTVAQAPSQLANMTENVKESFFKTQVPFGSLIYSEAKKNNLPPELLAAVVHTESKFHPTARSGAGAQGLMQLVPRTGRWLGADNLMDPAQNVSAGAKYLRYLTDRFNGNTTNAIAAYNAGEGSVRRFGGVPPFRETRNYVQRVQNFQKDLGTQLQNHIAENSE